MKSQRTTDSIAFPTEELRDMLTPVLREGAQKMLATAIELEVDDWISQRSEIRDEHGRQLVVRNGHQPARTIQSGVGEIEIRKPRVRERRGIDDVAREPDVERVADPEIQDELAGGAGIDAADDRHRRGLAAGRRSNLTREVATPAGVSDESAVAVEESLEHVGGIGVGRLVHGEQGSVPSRCEKPGDRWDRAAWRSIRIGGVDSDLPGACLVASAEGSAPAQVDQQRLGGEASERRPGRLVHAREERRPVAVEKAGETSAHGFRKAVSDALEES